MEKIRIGNDMRVNFSVYRNGEPESFDGASDIVTKLVNEAYNKLITHTYTIAGNIVQFDIDALQLTQCGKCRLFISYTKGGDYTVDSPAFELVNYTDQTGGTEIIGVEIVSINIAGDIGINRDGLSAYEVWESYPGNEGKTIEQYFTWLRENPTKIDLDGLNSNIRQLKFNTDTPVAPTQAGQMAWSDEEKTGVLHNGHHSHPIGKETFFTAKNLSGTSIANGKAVYAIGSTGANATIGLATTANGDIAQRTIGIATMDIPANNFGDITTFGEVNDINTSGLTEGALVYLGLNGNLTSAEPVAPTPKISLGLCIRSHLTQGRIAVYVRPIARLNKLTDVYAPNLLDGDVLRWNGAALRYEVYNLVNKADLVGGKVPASQLPAYVDDILEYANLAAFPAVGETGKLYVTLDTNLTYRWSGSAYTEVSKSLSLGETSATAFRGDRGKTAYDHSQAAGNPHGTTAAHIANTPAGTISATTVQAAINELDADRVQLETDLSKYLNEKIGQQENKELYIQASTNIPTGIIINAGIEYKLKWLQESAYNVLAFVNGYSSDSVVLQGSGVEMTKAFTHSGELILYNFQAQTGNISITTNSGIVLDVSDNKNSIADLVYDNNINKQDIYNLNQTFLGAEVNYIDNIFTYSGYINSSGVLTAGGYHARISVKSGDKIIAHIKTRNTIYLAEYIKSTNSFIALVPACDSSTFDWYDIEYNVTKDMTLVVPSWDKVGATINVTNKPLLTYQQVVSSVASNYTPETYVDSVNGSDANDGSTSLTALKTLKYAIDKGSNNIILLDGEYSYQDESLFRMSDKSFTLKGILGSSVIIRCGDNLGKPILNATFYEVAAPADINNWNISAWETFPLYIDGLMDKLIPIEEQHPCQRGHLYRLPSTLLKKVTDIATTSEVFAWQYVDSKIKIKSPVDITTYDIWRPAYSEDEDCVESNILLSNFEIRYTSIRLNKCNAKFTDVSVLHSCNSAFGINYYFSNFVAERVEVGGTYAKTNTTISGVFGMYKMCDCFQGHGGGLDKYGKRLDASAILIDCWGHDSYDDTCSDHGSWDTTIIGGLFEYANKGCIIPSNGQRCKIIGTHVRRGRYGFVSGNEVAGSVDNDNVKQGMYLNSCIAEDCNEGGYVSYSQHANMILINCLSHRNNIGYYIKTDAYAGSGKITTHNCKSLNDATTVIGGVTKYTYIDI